MVIRSACLGCALSLAFSAHAGEQGPYFRAAVGPALAENTAVKELLGPLSNTKARFDPGAHLDFAAGFNFNRWLGAELETGFIYNNIDRIGASFPDASLSHVPFLANLVLRYDVPNCKWVPYIGAGAGGDTSVLEINNSLGVDGSDGDVVFAAQAFAGLTYRINRRMSVGVGYKFFWADDPSWHVQGTGGQIRFGHSQVHAINAVFNMAF